MSIESDIDATNFLSHVGYQRFSGYFQYWQQYPHRDDSGFIEGTSFEAIKSLYDAEQKLAVACNELLRTIEVLLRNRFAHSYGRIVGTTGTFARGVGFTQLSNPNSKRVEEHALANLDRNKEAFITKYRDESKQGHTYRPEAYYRMPIWVAVEAFSFGSLSRLIAASGQSGVLDDIADSINSSRRLLPSQVRSFVYLRNRIAHCAQLWGHSVLDVPGLQPKTTRRAKQRYRDFSDHSIYKILIALDDIAKRSQLHKDWLLRKIEPILNKHPILSYGISHPTKYGEIHKHLIKQECD
ncbi:Abi family protein [Corynebacterium lowii]|uniref:Abi-like protein n=1 Tax=Corynebacterium lowii TaxID=1544413 RepID=A0A0Q1AI09_9CORY|nr:Abi family protein [Corynebacterium lowii]KQB86255.1 Abi-like protein [Corynebacterium lowii]MDP9850740.1 abortive infection bacteriophage resistance protein [Corynebacterium lowii]